MERFKQSPTAKELLERVLTIKERKYGPDHPELTKTLANLGDAYGNLGEHEKQMEMRKRALTMFRCTAGRLV